MKSILFTLLLTTLFSCGSSSKKPREFEVEYKVVDASNRVEPDWLNDVTKYQGDKNTRHFVSESEHAVKRLCIKSATARAVATVAAEVEQQIKNEYAEVTREDEDKNVEKFYNETLKQIVETEVSGIRVINQYWEKRKFEADEKGGSKLQYTCYTLVGISESRLDSAIKNAGQKFKKAMNESLKQ